METVGCRTIDATRCGPVAEIRGARRRGKKSVRKGFVRRGAIAYIAFPGGRQGKG